MARAQAIGFPGTVAPNISRDLQFAARPKLEPAGDEAAYANFCPRFCPRKWVLSAPGIEWSNPIGPGSDAVIRGLAPDLQSPRRVSLVLTGSELPRSTGAQGRGVTK